MQKVQNPGENDYYDWEGSDYDALIFLKSKGIEEIDGIGLLSPPYWPFEETPKITAAINYLCYEMEK